MVDRMFCRSLRRMACRGVVVPAAGGWDAVVVGVWDGKAAAVTGLWEVSDVPPLPLVPGDDCTLIGLYKYNQFTKIKMIILSKYNG